VIARHTDDDPPAIAVRRLASSSIEMSTRLCGLPFPDCDSLKVAVRKPLLSVSSTGDAQKIQAHVAGCSTAKNQNSANGNLCRVLRVTSPTSGWCCISGDAEVLERRTSENVIAAVFRAVSLRSE
jgi:hypothetical protein